MFGDCKIRDVLSTLWIFATVNYIFCDVFTLHYAPDLNMLLTGKAGGMEITQEFLLMFSVIMQLPMMMIVISKFAPRKFNRAANFAVALIMTVVQTWSLSSGGATLHYLFFSAFEIATTISIFVIALKWKDDLV